MNRTLNFWLKRAIFTLFICFLIVPCEAERVYPEITSAPPVEQSTRSKIAKKRKLRFRIGPKAQPPKNHFKNGRGSVVPAVLLWYVFVPLLFIGAFLLFFLLSNTLFWYLGLAILGLWLGISGIVFFPIQYFSFPIGMLSIVSGLILGSELGFFLLTGGIALVFAAIFALSWMVLMFLIGSGKHQPK